MPEQRPRPRRPTIHVVVLLLPLAAELVVIQLATTLLSATQTRQSAAQAEPEHTDQIERTQGKSRG
jgi:hypothetical protein